MAPKRRNDSSNESSPKRQHINSPQHTSSPTQAGPSHRHPQQARQSQQAQQSQQTQQTQQAQQVQQTRQPHQPGLSHHSGLLNLPIHHVLPTHHLPHPVGIRPPMPHFQWPGHSTYQSQTSTQWSSTLYEQQSITPVRVSTQPAQQWYTATRMYPTDEETRQNARRFLTDDDYHRVFNTLYDLNFGLAGNPPHYTVPQILLTIICKLCNTFADTQDSNSGAPAVVISDDDDDDDDKGDDDMD